MSHPTVVIELFENNLEALYSNIDISFIIVNRTNDPYYTELSGPYAPTLETSKLSAVIQDLEIPPSLLHTPATQPYFATTNVEVAEADPPINDEDDTPLALPDFK